MPTPVTTSSIPLTLEQVKEQFSTWRGTRTKLGKIPHPLWEAVSHLIKEQGYTPRQVASELGLNQQQMQLKIGHKTPQQKQSSSTSPDFIKVSLPPVPSSSVQPPSLEQKIWYPRMSNIELTRPDGTTLKISGLDPKDLVSLIQGFLAH